MVVSDLALMAAGTRGRDLIEGLAARHERHLSA